MDVKSIGYFLNTLADRTHRFWNHCAGVAFSRLIFPSIYVGIDVGETGVVNARKIV